MSPSVGIFATVGAIAVVLAAIAWAGDRRRVRRDDLDRVGFMPWSAVFLVSLIAATVFLGLAARQWLTG